MSALNTQKKIDETWDFCISQYGLDRCVAITLHGSQNYELDLPESDVDAKLFIVPTWDEVIFCKQPISKTIKGPYGDVNVTDIRLFIDNNLKKQNFNFLECLFTIYSCVNPCYADLWEQLIKHREEIAHYNPAAAVRTMIGQVENQWRRWDNFSRKDGEPFDNKKTLYHMARIHSAIGRYQDGLPFVDTLIADNHDWIMQVRLGKLDEEAMEIFFRSLYEDAHRLAESEYKGKSYELIDIVLDELQRQFTYRALYEMRVEE